MLKSQALACAVPRWVLEGRAFDAGRCLFANGDYFAHHSGTTEPIPEFVASSVCVGGLSERAQVCQNIGFRVHGSPVK